MKKQIAVKLMTVVLAAFLTVPAAGCGASSGGAVTENAAADSAAAEASEAGGVIYENASAVMEEAQEDGGEALDGQTEAADENRKLIKTVDMSVETDQFDNLLAHVTQRAQELGGYIERSDVYNGSYSSDYRSRSASLTVRIPSDRLDGFVTEVSQQSNVTNKSEYVEDVTLQYVDLESHKKALYAEQESLLAMLEQAESIEDILAINSQLTDVRYQIESMESQLRTYDNRIDYSTLYLDVEEIEHYVPGEKPGAGERIREGFVKNLRRVGDGVSNFFIELIIALPLLALAAVVIGACIGIVFLFIRAGEKRTAARKAKEGTGGNRPGNRPYGPEDRKKENGEHHG